MPIAFVVAALSLLAEMHLATEAPLPIPGAWLASASASAWANGNPA